MRDKFHYWKPARGMPYEDVENLRPETKKIVETWLKIYGDPKDVVLAVESAGNWCSDFNEGTANVLFAVPHLSTGIKRGDIRCRVL